jgi:hypothetical protein
MTTIHPVKIQMIEFANIRFVCIPGEPFMETGLWIQDTFGSNTLPIGYANENIGYIPTPEYYEDPQDALYEVADARCTVYGIYIPYNLEPKIRAMICSLISN